MSKSRIFTDRITKRSVQRLVKKWIKALRSGDFHQGNGQLRIKGYEVLDDNAPGGYRQINKYAYCCLGVACDIIDPKGWRKEGHKLGVGDTVARKEGEREPIEVRQNILGKEALDLLGLKPHANSVLAMMNDADRPFETIATFIEKEMAKA